MTQNNLYGLVLTGGKSTRMKTDKASLTYHGKMQSQVCFQLLSDFCVEVYYSNRSDQADDHGRKGYPQIHDRDEFREIGPLGGILSAMQTYPQVAWMVLACDLPFITAQVLTYLCQNRLPEKFATAYISSKDNLPEPLCAIYEPHAQRILHQYFLEGIFCPRKIMMNADIHLIELQDKDALININKPQEYRFAKKILKDVSIRKEAR